MFFVGIGRVSKYVLSEFFDQIDLLEQNTLFLNECENYLQDSYSKVINKYNQGIQEFEPICQRIYDCIWGQWVFGYITDKDLILFLKKCLNIIDKQHGFIVIKDNVTRTKQDIIDQEDGSVARSLDSFKHLFDQVEHLNLKYIVKQKKLPKELIPVRMFVLTYKE